MKRLNGLQQHGLSAMSCGFGAFVLFAHLHPSWRLLWLTCWAIGIIGCLAYVCRTVPSALAWVEHHLWRHHKVGSFRTTISTMNTVSGLIKVNIK